MAITIEDFVARAIKQRAVCERRFDFFTVMGKTGKRHDACLPSQKVNGETNLPAKHDRRRVRNRRPVFEQVRVTQNRHARARIDDCTRRPPDRDLHGSHHTRRNPQTKRRLLCRQPLNVTVRHADFNAGHKRERAPKKSPRDSQRQVHQGPSKTSRCLLPHAYRHSSSRAATPTHRT